MSIRKSWRSQTWQFFFFLTVFWATTAFTNAQSIAETSREPAPLKSVPVKPSIENVDERLRIMEEEIQRQAKLLDQMRAIINEQQVVIDRLSEVSIKEKSNIPQDFEADTERMRAVTPTSAAADQPATVENRVKKLEEQVLKIGPFRFSGDFRLRFDGIFRKADPTPPVGFAPLAHQQNARARYRLRLNFDTDINPKLSFHGQLATGALNNTTGSDQ